MPTVAGYLAYWLREVIEPNRAPLTYATYETLVRLYLTPGLGAKRLDRLQVSDVQTWLNAVRRTCQCCVQGKDARRPEGKRRCCAVGACCRQTPSMRTVKDLRKVLRAALSRAQTEELVTKNVAALVSLRQERTRRGQVWSSEEARAFLESARADGDPLYAAYVLVLVLGLRKGEVLGLRWDDVDFDRSELSVNFQLQRVRRELLHRQTKTETDYPLPLPDVCVSVLRRRRSAQAANRQAAGLAWQGDKLVFTTCYGLPIEPRSFNRYFAARARHAEVRAITVHDARRTCASLLVDLDVHPRVVMQILRHAQFAITMEIYTRVSSAATRAALKRLSDSLDG